MPRSTSSSTRSARRYASVPEAAAEIGCCSKTIRRRIADGTIPAYRLGRLLRVDMNEVDQAFRVLPTVGHLGGDAA